MAQITIPGRVTQAYEGALVAEESSRRGPGQQKWAEFYLYKLDDGRWLVHRIGKSVLYHREPPGHTTPSGREPGRRTGTYADLADEAEPCGICEPPYPDELGEREKVRIETDSHRTDIRDTPEEIVRLLATNDRRSAGTQRIEISGPVSALLDKAAETEPRFRNTVAA